MEHWKKNSSLRYFAGLALLLTLAGMLVFAGPAFARFRSGTEGKTAFYVREPEQICFVEEDGNGNYSVLDKSPVPEISENGEASMTLTVANGITPEEIADKDQKIFIRFVSSIGLMSGDEPAAVKLVFTEGEETIEIPGTAELVTEGSEYSTGGQAWVYTFMQDGTEFSKILGGGKLSVFSFSIKVDASGLTDMTAGVILKPQVIAEIIE